ncbi:MAG: hypothetical protein AAGB31_12220, partial [Bdellovibrio sp.]
LVFQEAKPRSLDLNYWNYMHNGVWYDHNRDIGEFISFGYIPGESLLGYQYRQGGNKSWHSIRFAIYKSPENRDGVLLVVSGVRKNGSLSTCMDLKASENTFYHCNFTPGDIINSRPSLSKEVVQIAGYISLCAGDNEGTCVRPSNSELQKYGKSSLERSDLNRIQEALKSLRLRGQKAVFVELN